MSNFKAGDLVRFKALDSVAQYCTEGTILRVVRVAKSNETENGQFCICEIVFGTWIKKDAYYHESGQENALFFPEELEALHDGKIQEG